MRITTVLIPLVFLVAGCSSGTPVVTIVVPPGPDLTVSALVRVGATWKFLDDGTDQGTAWREPDFDDTTWASGQAEFGYGDGDETTLTNFGPDPANKFVTTYFRREFQVDDPAQVVDALLTLLADDGALVYLNGIEVVRDNMPVGAIAFSTLATGAISGTTETTRRVNAIDPVLLRQGRNVLAVEVHQGDITSSDLSFDLDFLISTGAPFVVRGPYLQQVTRTSIIVRWRTLRPSESRVHYGAAADALFLNAGSDALATDHEVLLTDLTADTVYYYAIGTSTGLAAGADDSHNFRTAPAAGSTRSIRVWVIGDSGTANINSQRVADAYRAFAGNERTDVWLMLGDNAYGSGTDAQYQAAVFETYPDFLRTTAVWPTIGNHDAVSADSPTESGPYYDIFTLPRHGETGGIGSGTEAYYSFDYGNIHFICLDSQDTDRAVDGAMLTWLQADLADTMAEFVVAFWHHPPYSKGSHDSDDAGDSGGRLRDMRERALPLLEAAGVDLVLTGHSHSYERTVFLNGHYGTSDTLTPAMILDGGNGREAGDGAYAKNGAAGAVYVVAGNAGQTGGGSLDHPAMSISLNARGSLVLDIGPGRIDGRFLDEGGVVQDTFTILRGE